MYDFLDKIGLKAVLEAIKSKIPTSLPANGGNADTVGGKSASDFVLALTEAQTVNTKILIPDNVDVVDWLIKNAKIGTVYFRTTYSSGQSNLPLGDGNNNWTWFTYDGNRFLARAMVSDSSTRDFLLNRVNLIGGWKEISTTPIKSTDIFGVTDQYSNLLLWKVTDARKPILVTMHGYYAIPFLTADRDYFYYYAGLINCATHEYIPNTTVSGTVYYIDG